MDDEETQEEVEIVRVVIDRDCVSIDRPSKQDLLHENEGYEGFVDSIMESVSKEMIYDDSDTSKPNGIRVLYCPASKVSISEGKTVPCADCQRIFRTANPDEIRYDKEAMEWVCMSCEQKRVDDGYLAAEGSGALNPP